MTLPLRMPNLFNFFKPTEGPALDLGDVLTFLEQNQFLFFR